MSWIRRAILAFALMAGLTPAIAQAPSPVPALPDTERRTSYSISGTNCSCSVNFALYGDSTDYQNWVEVFLNGTRVNYNDATLGWTITSPSNSDLSKIARPITDAILTFNNAQTGTVQIVGARRPRRVSQFQEGRGVAARDLNQVLTDMIAQNRETWDKTNDVTGRAILAAPGETLALLPALANRQNMGACFNNGGNLVGCVSVPSTTITAGTGITISGTNPATIALNFTPGTAATQNTGTSGANVPLLNGNNTYSGTSAFTGQAQLSQPYLPGGTQTSPNFLEKLSCVRPEQYGALNDGSTDDTFPVITAANAAAAAKIGLCLTAGSGYSIHPIQFGSTNSLGSSGTCSGYISGTTLTILSGCSMDLMVGQTFTGTGVTAGSRITAYGVRSVGGLSNYSSNGQMGTYTVNNSQTVGSSGAPVTLTFTAPSMQGSASGTVLTIGTAVSGKITAGANVTCSGCPVGLFVTTFGTGTGDIGTYNLNQSISLASGTTFTFHPAAPASLPPFVLGDSGTESKFKGNGTGGPFPHQRLVTFTTGPLNNAWLFQYWVRNFKVDANSQYGFGLVALGLNGTFENIYSTGALNDSGISGNGCGELYIGTALNPVIYAHLRSLTARQNTGGHGRCMDGNDNSQSYNIQAVDALGLFSMGNGGAGWLIDYVGLACYECESESNASNSVLIDHSLHLELNDFYSEGNGGAFAGTANTAGVRLTGKLDDGVNSTLLGCNTCTLDFYDVTINARRRMYGMMQSVKGTLSTVPACSSTYQGAMAAITDSSVNTWGTTITGGGSNPVLAFCNGTNWTVSAK